tara:strand:- start:448 stop:990 length:543 start_codon:yes stop_codon:yes gene_type:complete
LKKILILSLLFFLTSLKLSYGKTLVISPGLGGTLSLGSSSSGSHVYDMGFGATGEIQIDFSILDSFSLGLVYGYSYAFASMNAANIIHSGLLAGYKANLFMMQKISLGYGIGASFDYQGSKAPYTSGTGPIIMISNDIGAQTTLHLQFHMISFPDDKLVKTSTPQNNQILFTFNRNYELF